MDPITQQGLAGSAGAAGDGPPYVDDVFSTFLYAGNASSGSQTITNGIDLSGEGGLVWIKNRVATDENTLIDTERGANKYMMTHTSAAQATNSSQITSFNSDGFSLGAANQVNRNGNDFVSWSFRKAPGFFDVVTWTGNGTNRDIAHNLGSKPGFIIVKRYSATEDWTCYHQSMGATRYIQFNSGTQSYSLNTIWNNTEPTSTHFTVGTHDRVNTNGQQYVAYIFAHDDQSFGTNEDEAIIKCGSYTGSGSAYKQINVGFEPQFVIFKNHTGNGNWYLMDTMRGLTADGSSDHYIWADSTAAENYANIMYPTQSGFGFTSTGLGANSSGQTYIYIAIRRPNKPPTAGTDVLDIVTRTSANPNLFSTSLDYVDAVWNKTTDGSSSWMITHRLTGTNWLRFDSNAGGSAASVTSIAYDYNYKVNPYLWGVGGTENNYCLKRTPGFFDIATYRGTGSSRNFTHNLGAVPELIITKRTDSSGTWHVFNNQVTTPNSQWWLNFGVLQEDYHLENNFGSTGISAAPTSTTIPMGNGSNVNGSGRSFVMYLFATLPGISKVGSYNGSSGNNVNVDCGFTAGARFVLIKRTDQAGNWYVFDTSSGIVSGEDPHLYANTQANFRTGGNGGDFIDPLNAGFTVTSSAPAGMNTSGGKYLFLAIA